MKVYIPCFGVVRRNLGTLYGRPATAAEIMSFQAQEYRRALMSNYGLEKADQPR